LDFCLALLSKISNKDEWGSDKKMDTSKEIIENNRIINHREKEYVENGLIGFQHQNNTSFKYAQMYDSSDSEDEDQRSDSIQSDDSYYEECHDIGLICFSQQEDSENQMKALSEINKEKAAREFQVKDYRKLGMFYEISDRF